MVYRGYIAFQYYYFSSYQLKLPVHVIKFHHKSLQHFSLFIIGGWVHTAGDVKATDGGDGGVQPTSGDQAAAVGVQAGSGLQAAGRVHVAGGD